MISVTNAAGRGTLLRRLSALKLKTGRLDANADTAQQLNRLAPARFLAETTWPQLPHVTRYLKAIIVAERKGQLDDRMLEFRWPLEELRVSFFAQELRTPQPVSVKRPEKAWAQLVA